MRLSDYMALCLGHPQHGYYMTRDPFGVAGDFTTAPEISQMFGEMIGVWAADIWQQMGKPERFTLLECGPGRGTLMADLMRSTKSVAGFYQAAQVTLLEMSPVLKSHQKQILGQYDPVWIDDVNALNPSYPIIAVANEFLDALPIDQVFWDGAAWRMRTVTLHRNDTLAFDDNLADAALINALPPSLATLKQQEVCEISLSLNQFLKTLLFKMKKQSGSVLFLDYGYGHSSPINTLQAVQSHRFESPLYQPGQTDITAHVDFENIGRIAKEAGVQKARMVTQHDLLRALGIELRFARLLSVASETQAVSLQSGYDRLMHPEQMGTLFKAMAVSSSSSISPAGFENS
jgi:NADH dehydrogenase [ubiquinone] 1 alpha subcomplex assembly factor 7